MNRMTEGENIVGNTHKMNIFIMGFFTTFGVIVAVLIMACFCRCLASCLNLLTGEKDAVPGRGEDIQSLKGYFRKTEGSFLESSPYGPLDPGSRSRNRYVSNTSLASTGSERSESSQKSSSSQKSDASSSNYFTAPDNTPHGSMNSLNSAALPPPPVRVKGPGGHPPAHSGPPPHPPNFLPPPPQPLEPKVIVVKGPPSPHEAVGARTANAGHSGRSQAFNAGGNFGSNASINTNPPGPQSALPAPHGPSSASGSSKK